MSSQQNNYTVYRHISPSGKVYIGITNRNVLRRWNYGKGYLGCAKFNNAINKYGWDNIKHEILFKHLNKKSAILIEIDLIYYYKSINMSYNLSDGGEGCNGLCGVLNHNYGKCLTIEHREKIGSANRGINSAWFGKHLPEEMKAKISNSKKGIATKITPVLQFDMNDNFIKEFTSLSEAAKSLDCDESAISKCCRGKRNHVKHFKWRYKYENNNN